MTMIKHWNRCRPPLDSFLWSKIQYKNLIFHLFILKTGGGGITGNKLFFLMHVNK